jgi:hypothetical protein
MQSLEHVIYASVATEEFGAPQLAALLQQSRKSNERAGLTGMLLHDESDGTFFQVVEGEPEAIETLLQKLCKLDDGFRGRFVRNCEGNPWTQRLFQRWIML